MSDFLVNLSANPTAKKIIRTLRLPVPLPQPLARAAAAWEMKPLAGKAIFTGACGEGDLNAVLAQCLPDTGAAVSAPGAAPAGTKPYALVFDGTQLDAPESLSDLYAFFHAHVRAIAACGRAVALVRDPAELEDPLRRAAHRAVEGFMRSLGKEVGRRGATAQTVYVSNAADGRVAPVLRFLLSKHSAYISGQPIHVTARIAHAPEPQYVQPLGGKTALVTGSARGIGAATARALAREGAKVIIMDREPEMPIAAQVAQEIGGTSLACDISASNAAECILDHVRQRCAGLDIVVHNAGITRDKTLGNMPTEKWDQVLAVNLIGLLRTNEALIEHIRPEGRIIAMSSVGGIAGNAGQTNYAATKAGLIGYVQALAPRAAARGITVNAVAPGFIETQMTAAMPMGTREVARRLCSLMQGGHPEDIAEAIVFLSSPGAVGITGETLRVCGQNFVGA